MDTIFQKIDEIEKAASKILDAASRQNKLLDQEQQARIQKFDEETDSKTAERIKVLQDEMHASIQTDLDNLRASSEKKIASMQETYETGHDRYTDEVCQRILRK